MQVLTTFLVPFDFPDFSAGWLEQARNVATVIAAGVALIGIVPLFINLRASSRSLRAKIYFDTLALLEGKNGEFRALRNVLDEHLRFAKSADRRFDVSAVGLDVKEKLDELARAYDQVGLLVKHGVVPTSFLFDFYSRPIVSAWGNLRELVEHERTSRVPPQSGHMMKFQLLAVGAALYRKRKYDEAPMFPISPKDRSMWKSWKKWKGIGWFRKPGD